MLRILTILLCLLTAFLHQGCRPVAQTTEASTLETAVPEFSASKGIFMPEATREILNLSTAEVMETTVVEQVTVTLCIFNRDSGRVSASGKIASRDASAITAGQSIIAIFSDGSEHEATIDRVIPDARNPANDAEIIVSLNREERTPTLGEFITGRISQPGQDDSITIPRSALLECSEGTFVYAVSGDRYVRTAVAAGRMNAHYAEILDGLYTGDEVVTHPVQSLWMTELAATKGGQSCCLVSPEGK